MVRNIVLHHSLTADGKTVSWQAIRRYHIDTMGWDDIGYHHGVELVNDEYEVLVGRPENAVAAAVKEDFMNARGIHVCFVGNFDIAPPPRPMLEVAVRRILKPLLFRHVLKPSDITGHHLYAPYKTCPGKLFDIDLVRRMCS